MLCCRMEHILLNYSQRYIYKSFDIALACLLLVKDTWLSHIFS